MDDQYVDVYIDARPQAYTYMQGGVLAGEVRLNRPPTRSGSAGVACAHTSPQEVFAHARVLDVHWPIVFCSDCLEILEGRRPFVARDAPESSGAGTFDDIIARKWAKDWPQEGKPRAKRPPPGTAWPPSA
jgi:hypothetical protein